jgi:hypothetical protein
MTKYILIAAAVVGFAACSDSPTAANSDPVGVYTLTTINGKAPPQTVSASAGQTVDMLSGTLTVTADHRFALDGRFRIVGANGTQEAPMTYPGSWSLRGSTIVAIQFDDPGVTQVSTLKYDGSTLTLADPFGAIAVTLVFKR